MFIPLQNSSNWLPEISNSLRFDGSNDYLYRVPNANATNQNVATISMWIKRSKLGVAQSLLDCYLNASVRTTFYFYADDTLQVSYSNAGVAILTAAKFRDPSAWYHLVYQHNIGLPRLWINGVEVAYTTQNDLGTYACALGYNAAAFGIGAAFNGTTPFDGYIANVCVVVGQSKAPTDFAYTDPKGQWRSLKKSDLQSLASAGDNNSFFLPFDNGTDTTTLGNDASSKGNNWTLTNMVRTGGADDCWSYDTPTNNFATLSAVDIYGGASAPISNGALNFSLGSSGGLTNRSTQSISSGKYYWELQLTATTGAYFSCGVVKTSAQGSLMSAYGSQGAGYYGGDGSKHVAGVNSAYGTSYSTPNVIGVALDCDSNTITFYRDNVSQGPITLPFTGESWSAVVTNATGTGGQYGWINFGQRPVASGQWYPDAGGYFRYAPPTGYKALSTKNLPTPSIPKPRDHFDVVTWVGDVTNKQVATQFTPDFVWAKRRNGADSHVIYDAVRGANVALNSAATSAETTANYGLDFDNGNYLDISSTGYFGGAGGGSPTFVSWLWKAGGAVVTNTAGTITSQVSANPAAGFSIVSFTGTGSAATVGHGLGVEPKMVIMKNRDAAGSWTTGHHGIGNWGETLYLDLTNAKGATVNAWNNTAPTTSVVSVGSFAVNTNKMILYCFAEVPGFSKIGSYTGNGSTDGPFVWCGFRPKYVLIKCSSVGGAGYDWIILDSSRDPINPANNDLMADLSQVEGTANVYDVDFTANGFKLRSAYGTLNGANTYIFMAFAEAPFKYANAR